LRSSEDKEEDKDHSSVQSQDKAGLSLALEAQLLTDIETAGGINKIGSNKKVKLQYLLKAKRDIYPTDNKSQIRIRNRVAYMRKLRPHSLYTEYLNKLGITPAAATAFAVAKSSKQGNDKDDDGNNVNVQIKNTVIAASSKHQSLHATHSTKLANIPPAAVTSVIEPDNKSGNLGNNKRNDSDDDNHGITTPHRQAAIPDHYSYFQSIPSPPTNSHYQLVPASPSPSFKRIIMSPTSPTPGTALALTGGSDGDRIQCHTTPVDIVSKPLQRMHLTLLLKPNIL